MYDGQESDGEFKASVVGYFDPTTHATDLETFEQVLNFLPPFYISIEQFIFLYSQLTSMYV